METNYETATLEQCEIDIKDCYDSSGNIVDPEKFFAILKNNEFREKYLSRDNFLRQAQLAEDPLVKAAAERMVGQAFPPESHWEMPDYYYPGLYSAKFCYTRPDFFQKSAEVQLEGSKTRTDAVLEYCGWKRKSWDSLEYYNEDHPEYKIVFNPETENLSLQVIDVQTQDLRIHLDFSFGLLCGMFLKCRELEYSKPKEVEKAFDFSKLFY